MDRCVGTTRFVMAMMCLLLTAGSGCAASEK